MIKINLVARRIPKAHLIIEKQLVLFAALFFAVVAVSGIWKSNVSAEIAQLESEIVKKESAIARLQHVEKKKTEYEKKQKRREDVLLAIKKLQARKIGPRPFLEALNLMLPPDIWLTKIKEKSFNITLEGYSFSDPAIAKLMRKIEESEHFSAVELTEIQKAKVQKEEVKRFKITSHWDIEPIEDKADKDKEKGKNGKKGKKAA